MLMPGAYYIERHEIGDEMEKSAGVEQDTCREVMKRIYDENPSYWPYGLTIRGHQSVYLIKDARTHAPVGFVGWQETREGFPMRKVGSYSIGILPEYRGQDFATEAVAKVLLEKSAEVDEVRCYVVPGNKKSKGLAHKLHIRTYEKF